MYLLTIHVMQPSNSGFGQMHSWKAWGRGYQMHAYNYVLGFEKRADLVQNYNFRYGLK